MLITIKDFQKKEDGAVLLKDEARRSLLTEWQKRKQEKIIHPFLNEKVEWGIVPLTQSQLLTRYLREDLDGYPPFLWK